MNPVLSTARLAFVASCALLASLGLVGLGAGPASAATEEQAKYAKQAFSTTNNVRDNRDRVRLKHSDCLQKFANTQANLLADLGQLIHQDLGPILNKCNLNLTGENLALGYADGRKVVKAGWMKSADHRANILEKRYRVMAIAARKTATGQWIAVQLFGRKG